MLRVAIIGGGPGGLMTACRLATKAGNQLSTTVYEASERVGGKIITKQFSNASVRYEAGVAELYCYSRIGPDPLRQLVNQLGLSTIEMGGRTVVLGDRVMRNVADIRRQRLMHEGPVALDVVGLAKQPCGSARDRGLEWCGRRCGGAYRTQHAVFGAD